MKFSISTDINEQIKTAEQAEYTAVETISTHGAYVVTINNAELVTVPSNAKFIELNVTTDDGKVGKVSILVMTKAGKSTYLHKQSGKELDLAGINMVRGSLLPLLGLTEMNPTPILKEGITHLIFKSLIGRRIGMLLDIKLVAGKNNKVYANQELVMLYNPETNQSATEMLKNEEPKRKTQMEAKLKTVDETTGIPKSSNNPFDGIGNNTEVETETQKPDNDFWDGKTPKEDDIPF